MSDLAGRLDALRAEVGPIDSPSCALLDVPQFTNGDVEAAARVTATQLHNWVSRGWIKLRTANPGKGRRRLFTGKDTIAVAVAAALQPFGMMQVAEQMIRVNQIPNRTFLLLADPTIRPGYTLAIVPEPDGDDWLYVPIIEGGGEPELPTHSCVVLDVDRLIIETLENLYLVMNDQAVAPWTFPEKKTPEQSEDEFLEFTRAAYRDEQGNRIYRGLTLEESKEYDELLSDWLPNRWENEAESEAAAPRYHELHGRNERARMIFINEESEASQKAPE